MLVKYHQFIEGLLKLNHLSIEHPSLGHLSIRVVLLTLTLHFEVFRVRLRGIYMNELHGVTGLQTSYRTICPKTMIELVQTVFQCMMRTQPHGIYY